MSTTGRLVPDGGGRAAIALDASTTTLGRAPGNAVMLDDREVSKFHAEVRLEGTTFVVRDLGSSNGTKVNGKRVTEARLNEGDTLELGRHRFIFTLRGDDAAVAILPASPIDKTTVLASTKVGELAPSVALSGEALRQSYERLRVAFEALQRLSSAGDLRALCERILEVTFQLVKAESGALFLFDDQEKLTLWAHRGAVGDGARIIVSRTIVDEVLRSRSALLAQDALTDARFGGARSVVMAGLRSVLCVPLVAKDRVFGILHVGNGKEIGAFTEQDLELVVGLGTGAGVALDNAFLSHRLQEEERARASLGRFLSPVVVDSVLARSVDLKRGGQELAVTVMFSDIRGFTPLTERSRAVDVVSLLNEYFDQMVEIVFRHGGVLDKFIGDALMAVWGPPAARPDDAARALACAHEMQETLESLNAFRRDRGDEPIQIGIGLASGVCVSGAIGARRRMEYTVIGDAVNLASRLAGLSGPGQILCDEATIKLAGPKATQLGRVRPLAPTQVKGKTKPVAVFDARSQA